MCSLEIKGNIELMQSESHCLFHQYADRTFIHLFHVTHSFQWFKVLPLLMFVITMQHKF